MKKKQQQQQKNTYTNKQTNAANTMASMLRLHLCLQGDISKKIQTTMSEGTARIIVKLTLLVPGCEQSTTLRARSLCQPKTHTLGWSHKTFHFLAF